MSKLSELRKDINGIDKKIIALLNKRADSAKVIGKLKKEAGASIYTPEREVEIYENIIKENKGPLPNKALFAIYREIMSGSLGLEKKLKIAYLGPEATFTHQAGIKKFGSNVECYACPTITDVFRDVEAERSDYGVVPVENSTEGMISHTLDMFINSNLKICSEIMLEISHNLLGKCNMKSVKKIYSKQEVFGQCRLWLEINMRGIALMEVSSTSKAAEIASQEKNSAAIASMLAAKKYRLNVIAKDIEDNLNNVTRFLVIGGAIPRPTKKDKTSIMFSVKDKVGALHDILVPFKKYNINLTKIESRPSKRKTWEYYFFVDMTGHCENKNVQKALSELEKHCSFLKILGSYPIGL
ncbi:MAG: prephenate dehydratase [Candidatus Omnitrophica bacterium]|nr:prephenate dehydratase [Candidatus Omnitrophota bacterium]